MIQDATEGLAQQDTAQLARDIQTGGQSAFGSRARLTGQERAEAMGRGLGKAVGELRSRGFQQAQQTAIGEDERQRQAQRASSGLASLAGQELSGARGLVDRAQQASQQRFGAAQNIAGSRQQRAASELAASRGLEHVGARCPAKVWRRPAGRWHAQQAAGQKLAAGQGYGNLLQQTAQAQLGAQQQLGGQLGQMAQQRYSAGQGLGQTLAGYGQQNAAARAAAGQTGMNVAGTMAGQYGQIGAQQAAGGQALGQAQTGYGGFLSGLGGQAQQAGAQDAAAMQGIGSMTQQNRQQQLDAQRAGLLQAQQAPLAQYQALMPFVNMAPAGQTQFQTNFGPAPSAMQAGMGTGLATIGALGNYYNPTTQLTR
jgi:Sec-independent protein translocase protein TatA